MITLQTDHVSITCTIPQESPIDDLVPILKGMLVCLGYSVYNVDEIFAEEFREIKDEER